jgi:hypothetical protein
MAGMKDMIDGADGGASGTDGGQKWGALRVISGKRIVH